MNIEEAGFTESESFYSNISLKIPKSDAKRKKVRPMRPNHSKLSINESSPIIQVEEPQSLSNYSNDPSYDQNISSKIRLKSPTGRSSHYFIPEGQTTTDLLKKRQPSLGPQKPSNLKLFKNPRIKSKARLDDTAFDYDSSAIGQYAQNHPRISPRNTESSFNIPGLVHKTDVEGYSTKYAGINKFESNSEFKTKITSRYKSKLSQASKKDLDLSILPRI